MTTIAKYIKARSRIIDYYGDVNLSNISGLYALLIQVPLPTNLEDVPIEILYECTYDLSNAIWTVFGLYLARDNEPILRPLVQQFTGLPRFVVDVLHTRSERLMNDIVEKMQAIAISGASDVERLDSVKSLTERYPSGLLNDILEHKKRIIYIDAKPLSERRIYMHFPGNPRYVQADWGYFFIYRFWKKMPGMVYMNYEQRDCVVEELEMDESPSPFTLFNVSDENMENFERLVEHCREEIARVRAERPNGAR
jgi:hypothetical protein